MNDTPAAKILYCRCAFAQVVPATTKDEVLAGLCAAETPFESFADLCEMSARRDPRLAEAIAGEVPVRIAACYPRAVKWLFHQAGAPFPDDDRVEVLNMRDTPAAEVVASLLGSGKEPNPSEP